jgi:hypothetical protein
MGSSKVKLADGMGRRGLLHSKQTFGKGKLENVELSAVEPQRQLCMPMRRNLLVRTQT